MARRRPSQSVPPAGLIDGDGPPLIQRAAITAPVAFRRLAGRSGGGKGSGIALIPDTFVPDHAKGARLLRAPRVTSAEWTDPADTQAMDRDPDSPSRRRARKIRGYRAEGIVERMHAAMPREVTEEHVKAANRLLDDYEIGVMGAQVTAKHQGRVDGRTAADMPQRQLDAIGRYHGAVAALGRAAAELLGAVVFHGMSCEAVAVHTGSDRIRVTGRVTAGLERLREHYWPDAPARRIPSLVPLSDDAHRFGRKDRPGRIRSGIAA